MSGSNDLRAPILADQLKKLVEETQKKAASKKDEEKQPQKKPS